MNTKQGFSTVAHTNAKILILGSMPSAISLDKQRYYAHPRNAFWPIMTQLFQFPENLGYGDQLIALKNQQLSLWDVIQSCERQGSLDSQINKPSIIANNFALFFQQHRQVRHIIFNGRCAEQEYHRRVVPNLATKFQTIPYTRLPSTSPAMASLTFQQKLTQWQIIKCKLLD
jgi:hypoxanthine-DNA glycosylase